MSVSVDRELLERIDPGCELGCYPTCEAKGEADCCSVKRSLSAPVSGGGESFPKSRAERLFLQTGKTPRELYAELAPHFSPVSGGEGEAVALEDVAGGTGRMTVVSMLAAVSNAIACIRASKFGRGAFYEKEHDKRADELNRARNRLIEALNTPSDPSATEGMRADWRPISEHDGHGPVLVTTLPESPKYLPTDPVTAFLDVTGVWRCLGSVGGGAELSQQPTHFAAMPERPSRAALGEA